MAPTRRAIRSARAGLAVLALAAGACRPSMPGDRSEGATSREPPRRIVSLIPAATEILFAIGAGDRLVGRTRWGVHPPEARSVPDVGDGVRPSIEAVLARDPDLVVLFEGPDTRAAAERLEALGVPTMSLRHNSIADLDRNIRRLGDAVGCPVSADRLAGRIHEDLAAIAESVGESPAPRVYYDVWPDPPMTVGRGSFLDSLITLAGGRNVFGDLEPPAPTVSLEAIVHRDPDLVIRAAASSADPPLAVRPGWRAIPAVAEERIVAVDADLLGRLGPRVGDAARALAAAIHPGRTFPEPAPPVAGVCE